MAGKAQELNPYTEAHWGTSGGVPLNTDASKMFTPQTLYAKHAPSSSPLRVFATFYS